MVDPQRDVGIYLDEARKNNLRIEHVIETQCTQTLSPATTNWLLRRAPGSIWAGRRGPGFHTFPFTTAMRLPSGAAACGFSKHWATPSKASRSWRPIAVHCKGGYRSAVAASLLQRAGYAQVMDVMGGFDAWQACNLPVAVAAATA